MTTTYVTPLTRAGASSVSGTNSPFTSLDATSMGDSTDVNSSVIREGDHSISALAVTWLLMIPLLYFAVDGVVRMSAGSHNSSLAASYGTLGWTSDVDPLDKMWKLFVYSACVCLIFGAFRRIFHLARRNPLLIALSMLAIASTLWSQFPTQAFMSGAYLAADVCFAFYLTSRWDLYEQMELFNILGWIVLAVSILTAVLIPAYGTAQANVGYFGSWIGPFSHKNACSVTVALLLSSALYKRSAHVERKTERIAFISLALFLIVMTQSRTGWAVGAALLAYVGITKGVSQFRGTDRAVVLMGLGAALAGVGALAIRYYAAVMLFVGKDATLTGRTSIWDLTFVSISKSPILGYGFQSFWHGLQGESANVTLGDSWGVPEAHNGYLEVLLGLGAIGLGLVVCTLLKACRDGYICYRTNRLENVEWYLCIIWLTLVANIAETRLMVPHDLAWIMYVMACVGLNNEARRARLGVTA